MTADDAALSALIDGALDAAEERSLRNRLDREPSLAARFEALRSADDKVRSAYAPLADEPLPERVLALLQPPADSALHANNVAQFAARRKGKPVVLPRFLSRPLALAAGIAFALGALSSLLVISQGQRSSSNAVLAAQIVPSESALFDLLQASVSGEVRQLDAQTTAAARLSFLNTAGEYCRELQILGPTGSAQALACRRNEEWHFDVVGFASAQAGREGLYRPAADETLPALEAAVDAVIQGAPLSVSDEQLAIARGWRSSEER